MNINVSNKLPKILFVLALLFFACSKKNLVYYVPSNASKSAINTQLSPFRIAPVIQLKTFAYVKDSPTTPEFDTLPNKSKKYSFSETETETKTDTENDNSKSSKNDKNGEKEGKYALLIVGLILLSIGSIWMISISNSRYTNYESVLDGCFSLFLSLVLTITGLVTTIVGAITAAVN